MSHVASPANKLNTSKTSPPVQARRADFARDDVFDLMSSNQAKRDLWQWQYGNNPCNDHVRDHSVALYRGDALVGFCGIMPADIKFDEQHYTAKWCCDLHVNTAFRRQGIAGAVYEIIEAESDVAMGFGTGDVAYSLKRDRGWQTSDAIEEYFYTNKAQSFKGVIKQLLQLKNKCIAQLTRQLRSLRQEQGRSIATRIDIQPQISLPEIDALWNNVENGYQRAVVRDGQYINWKYVQHPSGNYNVISLRSEQQELLSALVVRKTPAMAHIVDYVGPAKDIECKKILLDYFLRWSKGSARLHCISSCDEWNQLLRSKGFLKYPKTPRFTVITNWSREPAIADNWFLMTGDSDGDLLNAGTHQ